MAHHATELWLPEPYSSQLTDRDLHVHQQWAETSLQSVVDGMGADRVDVELSSGRARGVIDLPSEGDSSEAIAVVYPFSTDDSPAHRIRNLLMRDMLDEPRRLLLFPHNTAGQSWYQLDPSQPAKAQLAEDVMETAELLGVERLHVLSYSLGGMIAGKMVETLSKRFNTTDAGLLIGDPVNSRERTSGELTKDFTKPGFPPFNKAVNDSGIPALAEFFKSRGGFDTVKQYLGVGSQVRTGMQKVNKQIREDMRHGDFVEDFLQAEVLPARVLIARMAGSLICPHLIVPGIEVEEVDGYGHEGADNVLLFAKMAQKVIQRQTAQAA